MNIAINIRSESFKRYFANISWLLVERVFGMCVALFVGIYVARYLGPQRFGLLSYADSFVMLFVAVAALGLDTILVRELAKTPDRRDELLGTAFFLKTGGAFLMLASISVAIPYAKNDAQTNTLIAIIAFAVIFKSINVIDFNFQAQVQSIYVVHAQLAQLTASSIIKFTFIAVGAPLIWFGWVYLIDAVVLATWLVAVYMRNTGKVWHWQWKWQTAKDLLRDSWVLLFYSFFVLVNMGVDRVMLKHMMDNEAVGYYAVASKLSSFWYFIPFIIGSTVYPYIVKSKADKLYKKNLEFLFVALFFISIVGAVVITFLSYSIINILFGNAYISAARVLAIHIWTGLFVFHVSIRSRVLSSDNYQYLSACFMFFGVLCNILGNYFLIPLYGVTGAAYSSCFSWGLNVLLFPAFSSKARYFVSIFLISPIKYISCLYRI